MDNQQNESGQYCTFRLGGYFFGIDVRRVQEVVRGPSMTRVPLAPTVVAGLINLRGQIVMAIDLRGRIGLFARHPEVVPTNIIVRTKDGPVSLLVDDLGDVLDVDRPTFEPAPDTLHGRVGEFVLGVHKLASELLLLLDLDRTVDLAAEQSNTVHRV